MRNKDKTFKTSHHQSLLRNVKDEVKRINKTFPQLTTLEYMSEFETKYRQYM